MIKTRQSGVLLVFALLAGSGRVACADGFPFDVIAIKQRNTASGTTELNILDGPTSFQSLSFQQRTSLPPTDFTFEFASVDWDHDGVPDLVTISKANTGTHTTEVHILTGASVKVPGWWASPFSPFLVETGTALPETGSDWAFTMADWNHDGVPDLVGIKKFGTQSFTTEVHILSGAAGFQSFLLKTPTALPESTFGVGRSLTRFWDFALADWDRDGALDLIAVSKDILTGVRVQIVSGASGFNTVLLDTYTPIDEAGQKWQCAIADHDGDGIVDLVCINRGPTGTGTTEVHVLSGASRFQNFVLQTGTALGPTDATWQFVLAPWGRAQDLDAIFAFNGQATAHIEGISQDLVTRQFVIHSRFSMDRRSVTFTDFPTLGADTFKVTKIGGGRGVFDPAVGLFHIPLTIRYSTQLPFVGTIASDVSVVLTTSTVSSPGGVFTVTGSPLDRTNETTTDSGTILLVGVGKFRGGLFDGLDYKIRIPATLFPLEHVDQWLPSVP